MSVSFSSDRRIQMKREFTQMEDSYLPTDDLKLKRARQDYEEGKYKRRRLVERIATVSVSSTLIGNLILLQFQIFLTSSRLEANTYQKKDH